MVNGLKNKILVVITTVFLALTTISNAQTCSSPAPGSDWVCVSGGWLPPGHPDIPTNTSTPVPAPVNTGLPRTYTDIANYTTDDPGPFAVVPYTGPNANIINAARNGTPLPSGVVYFTPPLILHNIAHLRGTAGRTVLVPYGGVSTGPMIKFSTSLHDPISHYPRRAILEDLRIWCAGPNQIGIGVSSANFTFNRVEIMGCDVGIRFDFAVNGAVRDSLITKNGIGIIFHGVPNEYSITTIRLSGVRIAESREIAIWLAHGQGIVLDDSTIIEGNYGAIGIKVQPITPNSYLGMLLRDAWFESNGTNIIDPTFAIRYEGLSRDIH